MMNKSGGAAGSSSSPPTLATAARWRDTQLAAILQPLIPLNFREDLGEADFLLSEKTVVIFITEADIISGGEFRRRVVKFRQNNNVMAELRVVVIQTTPFTAQYFVNLQKFINVDLGLPVIPVKTLQETAVLLVRLMAGERKVQSNPFLKQPRTAGDIHHQLLNSLTALMPNLGKQRAQALLARFGTLQALCEAPRAAIEEVVGKTAAASLHQFFSE